MKRFLGLAVILPSLWASAAQAYDWEGAWGTDAKDCKAGGSIIFDKEHLDLSTFELECKVRKVTVVGPKSVVDVDCAGEGPSMKQKVSLRVASDRLVIEGMDVSPNTFVRCPGTGQKPN